MKLMGAGGASYGVLQPLLENAIKFGLYGTTDETTIEFSFGMEEFPEHNPRAPRMLEPSLETLDYWGGAPGPRFGAKGVIETIA